MPGSLIMFYKIILYLLSLKWLRVSPKDFFPLFVDFSDFRGMPYAQRINIISPNTGRKIVKI